MLAIKEVAEEEEGDYHIRKETGNKRKKPYRYSESKEKQTKTASMLSQDMGARETENN